MSNIYIQEPPTSGKVLIVTSFGDLDIELWSREAPKACRNFIQLCMEGYYNDSIFHRIIKGFIAQGGDPTGTGTGGDSIYGRPFKDEFHSRLRFVRRGLIAMANSKKDDNGSQFFFTLGSCPELQNKNTIFGKVAGDTLYNMLKLDDAEVDVDDRPLYPPKIISTQVLSNPFLDIIPRSLASSKNLDSLNESSKQMKSKGTKNFKLLSFGDEAEEDEEETNTAAKEYRGKSKSSHDLANDPNLSSVPAVETSETHQEKRKHFDPEEGDMGGDAEEKKRQRIDKVQQKLKRSRKDPTPPTAGKEEVQKADEENKSDDESEEKTRQQQVEEIRKQVKELKKALRKQERSDGGTSKDENQETAVEPQNDALREYYESTEKYRSLKRLKKTHENSNKEEETLAILNKFVEKMKSAMEQKDDANTTDTNPKSEDVDDNDDNDEGWLTHALHFDEHDRLAKDANIANEDTFEIYDPRNPINKRRRETSKTVMSEKRKK